MQSVNLMCVKADVKSDIPLYLLRVPLQRLVQLQPLYKRVSKLSSPSTIPTTTVAPCAYMRSITGQLYNVINPTTTESNYTCYAYYWYATSSSATLTFALRQDPGSWCLDDVSVYHGAVQILSNGGFETGSFSPWNYSGCSFGNPGHIEHNTYGFAHSGYYYYSDGCYGQIDSLSQTLTTVPGDLYVISFYIFQNGGGPTIIGNVTII
ncbi:unnamed protein product [Didymodactylos carnosus]|uniref:Uncharacterized protein n=1 Tax=Didymodactylos carnosus TaxID=1234261 RepID=A0A8S2R414_9BILA|nr:unnamed protein product [Didymodactylos carnosus]CAF4137574.1 unnamed protein product [Didymodactylos carnosus]